MDVSLMAASLESSAFGMWMRAGWSYPVANVLHLIGLALLVGPILLLDLRVLGFARDLPLDRVSSVISPFVACGIVLAAITGFALFAADAQALVGNRLLWIKLGAIVLALINAAIFRRFLRASAGSASTGQRTLAAFSIVLWMGVLVAGRMIAYV